MNLVYYAKPYFTIILLVVCSLSYLSCSSSQPNRGQPIEIKQLVIDIFAAHGFFGGSSYERYYLKGSELYRECGDLKEDPNPSPMTIAPTVFATHPSIYPKDGSRVDLSSEDIDRLHSLLSPVLLAFVKDDSLSKFPAAQSPFRLAQGGVFELKIANNGKSYNLKTTLNQISAEDNTEIIDLRDLFAAIRAIGAPMCGNTVFFGIGRR